MNVATSSPSTGERRLHFYTSQFTLFFLAFVGGLAFSRILYEWLFPRWLWLARPYAALPIAALIAFLIWALWIKFTIHNSQFTIHNSLPLAPLLLNLLWLFNPTVQLTTSRFIFAASIWLTAVLLINRDWEMRRSLNLPVSNHHSRSHWFGLLFVWLALLPVYLLTMSHTVGAADTFEFQVITPQLGIVHPTGYPLFLLLGKLFTLLPIGSLAWRLNFASVVYALAAMSLLYGLLVKLGSRRRPLPAILGATITGLTLTFWSQAIVAEVYALHALIVMAALYLMAEIGDWRLEMRRLGDWEIRDSPPITSSPHHLITPSPPHHVTPSPRLIYLLAFIIGLGLTNHLTTIFLIPPAILTVLFAHNTPRITQLPNYQLLTTDYRLPVTDYRFWLKTAAAFFIPLLLYAYLPLRWQAVNGEAMGVARFVDWVIGGRFQGALQLRAWLDDSTRYEILGRLFLENWGWFNLVLAGFGFGFMMWRRWQTAVPLLITWLGYTFYALNYLVPDLAVFLIPAQLIIGIWWGAGVIAIFQIGRMRHYQPLIATFLIIPSLLLATRQWIVNDQSADNGLTEWGRGVLMLPLAEDAAILADSEKIAPLLYLQVAEGLRPDLDISVWPDEAAYRAQVDGRLAANQTVYLARFLPGLQGIYHLRSVGPLTEVSHVPITQLPNLPIPQSLNLPFGPITLVGYELEPEAAVDAASTAVTFYWQATEPVNEPLHVYVRFEGEKMNDGRHPANNFYPTNAWKGDELVADFHLLSHPLLASSQTLALQVALAPPFTPPDELAWQTVADLSLEPSDLVANGLPYRAQIGPSAIQSAQFPSQTRPQTPLSLLLSGIGNPTTLEFKLQAETTNRGFDPSLTQLPNYPISQLPFLLNTTLDTTLPNGRYQLTALTPETAVCGWMQPVTRSCILGDVEISGVALPETAVNYADKVALLESEIDPSQLEPGGQLPVNLNWLALADMAEDYTVFLQVVDANDRIVGQVDSWPVQGTRPTSQWTTGDTIADSYAIPLDPDMPPGEYRLLVGWYLLGDGRRLPILNSDGVSLDDKLVLSIGNQ